MLLHPKSALTEVVATWTTSDFRGLWLAAVAGLVWLAAPGALPAWCGLAVAGLVLPWLAPTWALALLAATAPWERSLALGSWTVYSSELLLAAAVPAALWSVWRRPAWRRAAAPVVAWATPFFAAILISTSLARSPQAVKGALRWLEFGLALWLCAHWLRRGREAERVVWAVVLAATLAALVGMGQVLGGPALHPDLPKLTLGRIVITRASAEYGPNTLALLLAWVLPFAWSAAVWNPSFARRRLGLIAGVVMGLGFLAACSLTGAFALSAALCLTLWAVGKRKLGAAVAVLTVGGVLGLTALGLFSGGFWYTKFASFHDRLDYVRIVGRIVRAAPAFGVGPARYPEFAAAYGRGVNPIGVLTNPHSLYLTVLAELGLAGLVALLWALWRAARFFLRRARSLPAGWPAAAAWALLTGAVAFALGNVTEHGLIHDRGVHAALLLGAAFVLWVRPTRVRREERAQRFEKVWRREPGLDAADLPQALAERRAQRAPLYQLLETALAGRPGAEVVELGCGTALDSLALAALPGVRVHALDRSPTVLASLRTLATASGRPLAVTAGDVRRTGLPAASFDLVFSQGVLEHFPDPGPVWEEMMRLLKPGGFAVVDVPQVWNPYTLTKFWHRLRGDWPWGWETQYSVRGLSAAGRRHGLVPVAARGYGYHGGRLDLFSRIKQGLSPRWPRAWARWERTTGKWWMMNVVVLFAKP